MSLNFIANLVIALILTSNGLESSDDVTTLIPTRGPRISRGPRPTTTTTMPPRIEDYKAPPGCDAFYTVDHQGVVLQCEVKAINEYFPLPYIPSRFTQGLSITCTQIYTASSLDTVSLGHLTELLVIEFLNCRFDILPSSTFTPLRATLLSVSIRCNYPTQENFLRVQNSAVSQLDLLSELDLSTNSMQTIPPGELCGVTRLKMLHLSANRLDRLADLGFGGSCNATCGKELVRLDLSSNKFTSLELGGFCQLMALEQLLLRENAIDRLDEGAFRGLWKLESLDLSANRIKYISESAFNDLLNVVLLNVSQNNLTSVDGVFRRLFSLQNLYLSSNQITTINSTTFNGLTLLVLDLSQNKITTLGDMAFANMPFLVELLLDYNQLETISNTTLLGLGWLRTLMLNDNQIKIMEFNALASSQQLQTLILQNNQLTEVFNVTFLSRLTMLDFSSNQIVVLNENIFNGMENITVINLSRNNLIRVPELLFKDLKNMNVLNLSKNKLENMSEKSLTFLQKLTHLNLNTNILKYIPNLQLNTELIYLDVSHNMITVLDYGALPTKLTILSASSNRISVIDSKFSSARKIPLTHLDLSHNQLMWLSDVHLPTTLVYLNLDFNKIAKVFITTFQYSTAIETVSLTGNLLQTFNKAVLRTAVPVGKPRPQFILSGNPLVCDCNLWWINQQNTGSSIETWGMISDIAYLYCWMPVIGTDSQKQLRLIINVTDDSFWCEFQNYTLPYFACVPNKTNYCEAICPAQCRCYNTHDWSRTMTFCGRNTNVSSIPSGIPAISAAIYLDGINVTSLGATSFEKYRSLLSLYLNASHVKSIAANTFASMSTLQTLHLERNELVELTNGTFAGLTNLLNLLLFSNRLQSLQEDLFTPLTSLAQLQLHDNRLTTFPVWVLETLPQLDHITLGDNPWSCDCKYVDKYREWLQRFANKITDSDKLECRIPDDAGADFPDTVMPLIAFNASVCMSPDWLYVDPNLKIIVSVIATCILLIVAGALAFAYRHEMQVIIYFRTGVRLRSLLPFKEETCADDSEKMFDAFVAYSGLDEAFVVEHLLPGLEGGDNPFNLCLHQRNFLVGGVITNSILDAVECSRRTIVVMSENFATSNWCRFEFKSAHLKMMEDRCRRLIMIVLGDVPDDLDDEVKLYLKTNTYLQWGDKLFWQRLYYAMPDRAQKPK